MKCVLLVIISSVAFSQDTSILSTARKIDWTLAGAGTIPARSTICSTISAGSSAATVNSAIASCTAGQTVFLEAGSYTFSTGIIFDGKSNVTLRGAGADQTFITFTGSNGCGGKSAHICIRGSDTLDPDNPQNTGNWTANFSKGTTTITLSSVSNLQTGSLILLDQIGDNGDADPGDDVYNCNATSTTCTSNGGGSASSRTNFQAVVVTGVSGSDVTVTPPIMMPNWRSAKSPRGIWATSVPVTGVGIENLSIAVNEAGGNSFGITFFSATYSWIRGIRMVNKPLQGYNKHVLMFSSAFITVRDSYFFDCTSSGTAGACANDNYGVDVYGAGSGLVENNIFQRMEVPLMNEKKASGMVWGYNFTINNRFQADDLDPTEWMQASAHDHGEGVSYALFEGNDGNGTVRENYFGLAFFITDFRNRWAGWEPANLQFQSVAVHNYARSRFNNYIGNVLGTNGYHTKYQSDPSDDTSCELSIFAIGLGGNCGSDARDDTNTLPSIMRWGNYDLVNDAARFVSGEVPSGIANYSNPVPSPADASSLPDSLYLPARPSAWWKVNGVTAGWPPIGPDVTDGDVTGSGTSVNAGLNSHVWKIPARRCFEDVMGGTFGDTTAKTFNADGCYSAATSSGSSRFGGGRFSGRIQ